MNNIRNRVQLIGRLGADPEVKNFDNNRKMARMNIATTEVYYNQKKERVENTEWHNVVLWGAPATRAEEHLSKGMEVMVEGRLTHKQYTDKEGIKKYFTEVEAHDIVLMNVKRASAIEA